MKLYLRFQHSFLLLSLLFLLRPLHAQLEVDTLRLITSMGPSNVYLFDVDEASLPPISTPTGLGTPGYKLFFDFGDGDYRIFRCDTGAVIPLVPHAYPPNTSAARYKPKVKVTLVYSADKDPLAEKRLALPPITDEVFTPLPLDIDMGDSLVRIEAVTEPVPGDSITFILSYRDTMSSNGVISYKWDDKLILGSIDFYHGESLIAPGPTLGAAGPDSLSFSYRKLDSGEVRNVFLTFKTVDFTPTMNPIGDSVHAKATYLEHGQEGLDTAEYHFRVHPSHDPNSKVAFPQVFFRNQERLTYTIRFQNEGKGPARHIAVVDEIDPHLDLSTLKMEYARIAHGEARDANLFPSYVGFKYKMDVDHTNRMIQWVFDPVYLSGTQDPSGYMGDLMTSGEIVYSIRTQCPIEPGTTIPNDAEIFFDGNGLQTDTTYARRACCDLLIKEREELGKLNLPEYVKEAHGREILPETIELLGAASDQEGESRPDIALQSPWLYYYPGKFSGVDLVSFRACDKKERCDTFVVYVCARLGEREKEYLCGEGPCLPPEDADPEPEIVDNPIIRTFPNPMEDVLSLDYRRTEQPIHRLELVDLYGNVLRHIPVRESGKSVVDVANLRKGIYFLRINRRWMQKLIK